MDSISPLAKILAEANGIDWRSIQGSGTGGSIVEQDILNYLSRVMSGDEEPPATPVDEAPPGWTGEMPPMPAAVAASGLQALSAAGVESDITDFVAQQSQSVQPQSGQVQAGPVVQAAQPQFMQPQAVQAQFVQPEPAMDFQPAQPTDAPSTTVYRPAEVVAPVAFMDSPVSAASAVMPMEPQRPLEAEQPLEAEIPVQAAPVLPTSPAPEFELGADGDSDTDLEFELDDELPDDGLPEDEFADDGLTDDLQATDGLPLGSLSAPLQPAPVVEPVAAFHQPEPQQTEPEQAAQQLAVQQPAVQEDVQAMERPAYDPVELDSEAEFLLADALPVSENTRTVASEAATFAPVISESAPSFTAPGTAPGAFYQTAAPVPETASQEQEASSSQENRPSQEGVAEVAATASAFGLGGFLSRLYGSSAAPAAQPVAPEVPPAPVAAPETVIGTAHSEPYMPSFDPAPGASSGAAEAPLGSPLLGEPLISQAPPIPDTPVAAPLVADQWRDRPEGTEAEHAESRPVQAGHDAAADMSGLDTAASHDPFMLGSASADQELTSVEPDQAVSGSLPAVLGQPIALPEAHEGGLEQDHAEPVEPAPLHDAPVQDAPVHDAFAQDASAESESVQPEPAQYEPAQPESMQPEPVQPGPVTQNWAALVEPQTEQAEPPAETAALDDAALPAVSAADVQTVQREPAESQSEGGQPEDVQPVESQPAVVPAVDVQPLRSQPSGGQASGAQAITLRLNVDLSVLEAARAQLSEALYREVPLSLLVARAASRSLVSLGLSTSGGVALADHAGQPLAADLSADFRASLDGLGQPAQNAPALLVLDAAELGLDELHRGECSLSVGGSAAGANALSLRGDLDPVRGAKFLHEVAALLDTPILLLF
ncbi:E3 binding domain-containing protein [Deinococcus altitudinis]|uniref:E3 binding domain-containing protein n=1 Tax=Deinococcus altitudinis TaxID=468914 RepID=UPI003891AC75